MPLIRTWFTEALGGRPNNQYRNRGYVAPCSDMELNFMECMEAYGSVKGTSICMDWWLDFTECMQGALSYRRGQYMQIERIRQIVNKERPASEIFGPKVDRFSHVEGPFTP